MYYKLLAIILTLTLSFNFTFSQTVDLSSVDEFFKIASALKEGKMLTAEQWKDFDSSSCYKQFAERENKTLINTIKTSMYIAFGNKYLAEKDSILNITQEEMSKNTTLLLKKLILVNYLDVNFNYTSIKSFRENYNFNALIEKAKQRVSSFLQNPIDSCITFKPIYFFFITADGKVKDDGIFIDLNLIFKKTEEQRINFIAHEFFHNYRENFENHDFNYKNYINHCIDIIHNEGIADLIDKTEGYKIHFTKAGELPEMVKTWENLYNQAPKDLEKFQNLILKYNKNEISEKDMEKEMDEIVKFNGHPIGFFMANQIVSAGYKNEILKTFYNPYEFFYLYNISAKKQNLFQLNDEFMKYLNDITKDYYK